MVAPVSPWAESPDGPLAGQTQAIAPKPPTRWIKSRLLWAAAAVIALLLVSALLFRGKLIGARQQSSVVVAFKAVGVLPFLDLTEGMRNETFADGMTENLIARLSKVPGLHVPSAPAAFIFKGRQAALAEMAKNLGVAYVLDGSVRKAGARLRVSARLMRADNGHVLWSETYDRPFGDLLMVQDDIVSDVSKTLAQSFDIQQ